MRTTYYAGIGRLLMSTEGTPQLFEQFMSPLSGVISSIQSGLTGAASAADAADMRHMLVGVVRDLRGIVQSCTDKAKYAMFFDWFYPEHMSILVRGIETWSADPGLAVPILKFMCEFVHNKQERMQFSITSPNGILLFRETAAVLDAYGSRLLELPVPLEPGRLYSERYKGITVCFTTLRWALSGEYCNFGVFRLYNDNCLEVALQTFFKLVLSIPLQDLLEFPKLCTAYYFTVLAILRDHTHFLASGGPNLFQYMAESLKAGIFGLDTTISTNCCNALDQLLSYVYKELSSRRPAPEAQAINEMLVQYSAIFDDLLYNMLKRTTLENVRNQWSISRPMLGLILSSPDGYMAARERLVADLPYFKQDHVRECFEKLMANIDPKSLAARNRDAFSQNLTDFRREVQNFSKNVGAADGTMTTC